MSVLRRSISNRPLVLAMVTAVLLGIASQLGASPTSRSTYLQQAILAANAHVSGMTRAYKFQAMSASPFAFYRATAHLYYADLAGGTIAIPSSWRSTAQIETWLSGDAHSQNLGFFTDDRDKIVFDLNDFDESTVAPFYFDLIRYCASLHLMRPAVDFSLSASEADDLCMDFLKEYEDTLGDVRGNRDETQISLTKSAMRPFVKATRADLKNKRDDEYQLDKWTVLSGGQRGFDFSNPKLRALDASESAELNQVWSDYLNHIAGYVAAQPAGYFQVKSRAVRLFSGLGSLGVRKVYVLIEGDTPATDDDRVLEVKEQRSPAVLAGLSSAALAQYTGWLSGDFGSEGQRAVVAAKALLNHADDHLGSGVNTAGTRSYLVRERTAYDSGFDPEDFKREGDLKDAVQDAGRALALAHARADRDYDPNFVNYSFEAQALQAIDDWHQAKRTMAALAEDYAAQVIADHAAYVQLLGAGQIQ